MEDRDLILRARRGDVDAFNMLVSRWGKPIYNYLLKQVRQREDALDLSQATFLKAYRNLGRLQEIDLGFVAPRDVLQTLAEQLENALLTSEDFPAVLPELRGIARRYMRQCRFLPVSRDASSVTVAMSDPLDFETLATIRNFTGLEVKTALAAEQDLLDTIDKYFGEEEGPDGEEAGTAGDVAAEIEHLRARASEAPVIRLVNNMISQAIDQRASDIHIEPFEKAFKIRYRVDGVSGGEGPNEDVVRWK